MAPVKEDKEVRFDTPFSALRLAPGEHVLCRIDSVEDSRGNAGERGRVVVTSLRILWQSTRNPRISVAIGYSCWTGAAARRARFGTALGYTPEVDSVHIQAITHDGTRYEFVFTDLLLGVKGRLTPIMAVHRAYTQSRGYREVKLRGSCIRNGSIQLLNRERILAAEPGAWSLSGDRGSLGSLTVTSVRSVWYSEVDERCNVSVPHLLVEEAEMRESKFGPALVMAAGGLVLGFRLDPPERLHRLVQVLRAALAASKASPVLGTDLYWSGTKEQPASSAASPDTVLSAAEASTAASTECTDVLALYAAHGGPKPSTEVEYYPEFGLAIEKLQPNLTLTRLWDI